jgi:hypothetical protein
MSVCRFVVSIPAVLLACALGSAGLGGCYDLSTNGPRPEDFAQSPGAPQVQEQNEAQPASPTALDRSDVLVQALAATPSARTDEAQTVTEPAR